MKRLRDGCTVASPRTRGLVILLTMVKKQGSPERIDGKNIRFFIRFMTSCPWLLALKALSACTTILLMLLLSLGWLWVVGSQSESMYPNTKRKASFNRSEIAAQKRASPGYPKKQVSFLRKKQNWYPTLRCRYSTLSSSCPLTLLREPSHLPPRNYTAFYEQHIHTGRKKKQKQNDNTKRRTQQQNLPSHETNASSLNDGSQL